MPVQIQGYGGVVADVGGTTFRAIKTVGHPVDHGAFGQYRMATTVPLVVTQAANGTLFSFRWGDASRLCLIHDIRLQVLQTAAATATIMPSFEVVIGRSWTVSDSAGTALTITGNEGKKRTSMGTTLVTDIRKSALAAGLTAGTRTLDANPLLIVPTQQTITTPNTSVFSQDLDLDYGQAHPIVLAQNEGFIVRGPTVVFGAAGTANLVVDVAWAEVAAY
jgi:hypothetical protein